MSADVAGSPRLWWCNADFDLTLAHGGGKMPAKILEAAGAMAWPLWPALAPEDSLIVPAAPPDGFREYLQGLGLRVPHFVTSVSTEGEAARGVIPPAHRAHDAVVKSGPGSPIMRPLRFTPFGWNAAAAARNSGLETPSPHPPLEVVRQVNSREFSRELERALCGAEVCPATFCRNEKAVRSWLDAALPGRYVAKGNHGHAGIGQFRFEITGREPEAGETRGKAFPASSPSLYATLKRVAARHGGVVIEEELTVTREWGVLFRLRRDGGRSRMRRHRLLTGPTGGYAGALVLPEEEERLEPEWHEHRAEALHVVDGVADALHTAGYFGPVGLDMFTFFHAGVTRLRPLVDLNARLSMAGPAHGLAARFRDRAVLFRQFSTTSLGLPGDYRELSALCDKLSFNPRTRRGAICVTPLLPLTRVTWAIIGHDEADALALQNVLLGRLSA